MENEGKKQQQLVLVPCPFQGHINPMVQLGAILHSKGFSITVVHTQYNSPNPSNYPHFAFLSIPDGISEGEASTLDFIALITALNNNSEAPLRQHLNQLIELQEHKGRVVCIIYDAIMYKAEAVANQLMLPSIILKTSSAATSLTFDALPQLHAQGYYPHQDSMEGHLVPGLHPFRCKDLPAFYFPNFIVLLQFIDTVSKIRTSSAIIWNTVDCLEHSYLTQLHQKLQVPFFSTGPLHKIAPPSSSSLLKEDMECLAWLDKQGPNSVIYVSIGSLASINENEVVETAWGLANSEQPFLWVIRPGSIPRSDWMALLPESFKKAAGERGCIVEWAPQKEVLGHDAVGGFWSHCGWNSTLESICAGVPMICQPIFGDQRLNARVLSHTWRIGHELDNGLERGQIEKGIRRLMASKEGEEMRQRANDLKMKVEISIQEGGASYNSINNLVEHILSL